LGNFPLRTSPNTWVYSLSWTQLYHSGNQDVFRPGFSVTNFVKARKRTHWLVRVWNWPQEFT
jgi:hypothetical protein